MLNEKNTFRLVATVSVVVLAAVIVLNRKVLPVPDPVPAFVYQLPALNAILNGSCTVLLIFSFLAIRKRNIDLHKKINLSTFFLSSVFLISYITYHWMAEETRFPAEHPMRPWYLAILISHIVLAALVLPMVLMSFYYGLKMDIQKHRRLVRFTFPIWLYVTASGVLVYLMISPYYSVR
jgi:putative membrane protein